MIRRVVKMAAALAALLCLCGSAFALSNADYRKLLKDPAFKEADEALTGAWSEAKNNLTAAQFEELRGDQRAWIAGGRDEEARDLMDGGMKKAEAYAEATMNRVIYINGKISQAFLMANPVGAQGLYERRMEGQPGTLEVYWYDESSPELYVVVEAAFKMSLENANIGSFKGHGNLGENGVAEIYSDDDDTVKIMIQFSGEEAEIITSEQFKASGFLGHNVLLDGTYRRIRSE